MKPFNSILKSQKRKAQEAESEIKHLLTEIRRLVLNRNLIDVEISQNVEKISEYIKDVSKYDKERGNDLEKEITKALDSCKMVRKFNKQDMSIINEQDSSINNDEFMKNIESIQFHFGE